VNWLKNERPVAARDHVLELCEQHVDLATWHVLLLAVDQRGAQALNLLH
jgi:hypothetical protein